MQPLLPSDPKKIGPFDVVARLGQGGMGQVFLATDGRDSVALKIMHSGFGNSATERERFRREVEALRKVKSPFVAGIHSFDVEGDIAWLAIEFVNGPDLQSYLSKSGPLPVGQLLSFTRDLLQALIDIHQAGVIHRDIKPTNVLIATDGRPKIIDFGIAQQSDATSLTKHGVTPGSPAWLSPEQLEAEDITSASDMFSAGSVITYAGTGHSPWPAHGSPNLSAIYRQILDSEPDLSGLEPAVAALVRSLLNKDPAKRPKAGQALERLTRDFAASGDSTILIPKPIPVKKKRGAFAKIGLMSGLASIVAIGLGMSAAVFGQSWSLPFIAKAPSYVCSSVHFSNEVPSSYFEIQATISGEAITESCLSPESAFSKGFPVEICSSVNSDNQVFGVIRGTVFSQTESETIQQYWSKSGSKFGCRAFAQRTGIQVGETSRDYLTYKFNATPNFDIREESMAQYAVYPDGEAGSYVITFFPSDTKYTSRYLYVPELGQSELVVGWPDGEEPTWVAPGTPASAYFQVKDSNVESTNCWSAKYLKSLIAEGKELSIDVFDQATQSWTMVSRNYSDVGCGAGLTQRKVLLPMSVIVKASEPENCNIYSLFAPATSAAKETRLSFCVALKYD